MASLQNATMGVRVRIEKDEPFELNRVQKIIVFIGLAIVHFALRKKKFRIIHEPVRLEMEKP